MRELMLALPQTSMLYLGDTARLPYGDKSQEAVVEYSLDNARFLLSQGAEMIVIACNTASAFALPTLKKELSCPVLGVVKPGASAATAASKGGAIGVLGTSGTIGSGVYQSALLSHKVVARECPLFVPLVEEHFLEHPATYQIASEYLAPLKEAEVDTVLLGCTHYPLLRDLIMKLMGEKVAVVDSAKACARQVEKQSSSLSKGCDRNYFVTDHPTRFEKLSELFLGLSVKANLTTEFFVEI